MIIPREDDKVRLYIQLDSKNGADTSTMKRVDKSQMSPHQLLDVCIRFFRHSQESEHRLSILGTGRKEIISALHFSNPRVF